MYCLDTNIIIDILRGDEALRKKVKDVSESGEDIYLTPITICELFRGAYGHARFEEKLHEVEFFISSCFLIDFNILASKEFGKMHYQLEKSGKIVGDFDLMIAAIAKVHGATIVTRDKKHFEHTGVRIEVW